MDLSPERTGHADFYHPARTITGGSITFFFSRDGRRIERIGTNNVYGHPSNVYGHPSLVIFLFQLNAHYPSKLTNSIMIDMLFGPS
jgi:hypothetical protein